MPMHGYRRYIRCCLVYAYKKLYAYRTTTKSVRTIAAEYRSIPLDGIPEMCVTLRIAESSPAKKQRIIHINGMNPLLNYTVTIIILKGIIMP